MSIKLWQKIKKLVEKREREAWLKLYGFDNACPHCDTWQGNCNGVQGIKPNYPDSDHDAYKCGNCKRWFIMDMRGMIGMNAKDQSKAKLLDEAEIK